MLKIRLQRVGRVHEPSFRLVLTESTNSTKSGRFKEILGSYDPRKTVDILKTDRIKYWLSQGASPTPTVHNLLATHKIVSTMKLHVSPSSKHDPKAKVEEVPPTESNEGAIIEEVATEEKAA
jgi:small subunit ribosomal protein S16